MEPIFYINGDPVKGISDLAIYETDIAECIKDHTTYSLNENNDCLSFNATIKLNKVDLLKLLGIYDWVIDNCYNRRVVHLIKYGKNERVRNKNFNRALMILNKMIYKNNWEITARRGL